LPPASSHRVREEGQPSTPIFNDLRFERVFRITHALADCLWQRVPLILLYSKSELMPPVNRPNVKLLYCRNLLE